MPNRNEFSTSKAFAVRQSMTRTAAILVCAFAVVSLPLFAQTQRPKIYAQKLVDKTISKHPGLVILAMHVTPPNSPDNVIIASNIGRIGKKADEDDMSVINTGKSRMEVNKAGDGFSIEPLFLDASKRPIGVLGITLAYKAGDDKAALVKKAEMIRDELARQIPSREKLFEPTDK